MLISVGAPASVSDTDMSTCVESQGAARVLCVHLLSSRSNCVALHGNTKQKNTKHKTQNLEFQAAATFVSCMCRDHASSGGVLTSAYTWCHT